MSEAKNYRQTNDYRIVRASIGGQGYLEKLQRAHQAEDGGIFWIDVPKIEVSLDEFFGFRGPAK